MKRQSFGIILVLCFIGAFYLGFSEDGSSIWEDDRSIPCQEPLTYQIGTIDSQFNISEQELKKIMQEVESIWETALGRDLLQHSPSGTIPINLVYGEEQQRTEKERQLSKVIETLEQQIKAMKKEYSQLSASYEERKNDFDQQLSKYRQEVNNYNNTIEEWQTNGPQGEEGIIEEMQLRINRLKDTVREKETKMETLRQRTNRKSQRLNELIDKQNNLIAQYDRQFGEDRKFDQGQYIKQGDIKRINIYQFSNRAELTAVLAHETGHAMGLDHVDNPKSIMNPMMGEQDIFNLSLTEEDLIAIRNQCNQ